LLEVKNEEFVFQTSGNKGKIKAKIEEVPPALKEQPVKKSKEKKIEKVEETPNPLEYYKVANALLPLPKDSSSIYDDNGKINKDALLDDSNWREYGTKEHSVISNLPLPISAYGRDLPGRLEMF
jgi:hypothetical protein